MFIQNVSMASIIKGNHINTPNTALIQIQDYGAWQFVKPAKSFIKTAQFKFDDHDDPDRKTNCTTEQADEIGAFLISCYNEKLNVIVHCHAGLCRSGAVAEAGVILGFEDTGAIRMPNILVKTRILKSLGITNSWD